MAALVLAGLLLCTSARADDSIPTAWMEQAGTAPLLHAPPPPFIPTICVIDTGVTPTPDLDIADRTSLVGDDPNDVTAVPGAPGHGTTVAHFAAGKVNGWGGAGAFPHARITSVRVFATADGGTDWQDYLSAMNDCWYRSHGTTRVILMSLGGPSISSERAAELENRIEKMRETFGVSVVAAGGNGGSAPDFPGRFPATITVAAAATDGSLCAFSARGTNVDIAAPGCPAEQAGWDGELRAATGTSFAAPVVAGVLAAIRAYAPQLTASQAEDVLLATARNSTDAPPLVDAAAALRAIGRGDLAVAPAQTREVPVETLLPHAELASATVQPLPSAAASRRRVPPPRLRIQRLRRNRLDIRVTNRPRRAIFELDVGRRRISRQSSRIRFRTEGAKRVRARFLSDEGSSAWTIRHVSGG